MGMDQAVTTGIFQGLDQGIRNFLNIKNALTEQGRQKKQFDIEHKMNKLKLQSLEDDLSPEKLEMKKKMDEADYKAKMSANNLNVIKIRAAEVGIRKDIEDTKNELLSRARFLRMMQENKPMAPGTAMSFGGLKIAGPKQKDETNEGLDFVNDLRSGGGSDNDLIEEYNTTKDKNRVRQIEDILTKKGYNFE